MMKIIILFFLVFLLLNSPVYAQAPTPQPCSLNPNSPEYQAYVTKYGPCPAGLNEFEEMVGNIISVFAGLGFIALLVMLVWAGFKYLTSGGEPKAIQSAHAVTTWALLGILFMAIAWLLLQLIAAFTEINLTTFDIKTLCGIPGDPLKFCKP